MTKSMPRRDIAIAEIYRRQMKTVYRVCFAYMKNPPDTEDAVQETFCRLIASRAAFENEEHEKRWLIRTATNVCKNSVKHWFKRRLDLTDYENLLSTEKIEVDETLEVVLGLPNKYKTAVYLYYYEGYTTPDIAQTLQKPPSTIRNYLHEARRMLKKKLGGDFCEK